MNVLTNYSFKIYLPEAFSFSYSSRFGGSIDTVPAVWFTWTTLWAPSLISLVDNGLDLTTTFTLSEVSLI